MRGQKIPSSLVFAPQSTRDAYMAMTVKQLRILASKAQIPGRSRMNKSELVTQLLMSRTMFSHESVYNIETLRQGLLALNNPHVYIRSTGPIASIYSATFQIHALGSKLNQRGSRRRFANQTSWSFQSPSGTWLVAPLASRRNFANIYQFAQHSDQNTWNELWHQVEQTIKTFQLQNSGQDPVLYTLGKHVPWLHVRIEKNFSLL
jgi:hypothetical protein